MNKAILNAMDIRKNGQLDFKQKVILATSFTFQLLSHVFLIVSIALLALPLKDQTAADGNEDASLTVAQASILLSVPIILRWISISVLHCCLAENETRFRGSDQAQTVPSRPGQHLGHNACEEQQHERASSQRKRNSLVNWPGWHQHPDHLGNDYQSTDNQEPSIPSSF